VSLHLGAVQANPLTEAGAGRGVILLNESFGTSESPDSRMAGAAVAGVGNPSLVQQAVAALATDLAPEIQRRQQHEH
jgi:hypothetical protein